MLKVDNSLIEEAGRRLTMAAPGSEVILFGSHARGEADPRSDVDFLVVEPEVDDEARESVRLLRELRGLRIPADSSSSIAITRIVEVFAVSSGKTEHLFGRSPLPGRA